MRDDASRSSVTHLWRATGVCAIGPVLFTSVVYPVLYTVDLVSLIQGHSLSPQPHLYADDPSVRLLTACCSQRIFFGDL